MRAFEQVKESILNDERAKYVEEQRETALAPLKNDPATKVNQAAIEALIVKIDPEQAEKIEKAAAEKRK